MDDSAMDDALVIRRSKRTTAGNRMEAALAEFKAEELGIDLEEDADFALDKDEEDLFESDFESTDEEGAQEDVDAAAEKLIRQEESRVRNTGRSQLERITALAHARQAATFNPISIAPPSDKLLKGEKKLNRRVSLGFAVNAETGEVLDDGADMADTSVSVATVGGGKRHSMRTHTLMNTSASVNRSRDEVRKQSSILKRVKIKIKAPTQAELVARALDMEEGNTAEHRNYLTLEEEKRKKARVARTNVQGPLVRWISKKGQVKVLEQPPPQPAPAPMGNPYPKLAYTPPLSSSPQANSYSYSPQYPPVVPPALSSSTANMPTQPSPFPQWPPPPPTPAYLQTPLRAMATVLTPVRTALIVPPSTPPSPPPPPSRPIERKETVGQQFVVHELGQTEKASKPTWNSTMTAMFGDHANWERLRVYTSKGRPYARPTHTCPITGKVAKYLDPRTSVPYADLSAYRTLSKVLRHEYLWSSIMECYVSREGSLSAQDNVSYLTLPN